MRVTLQMLAYRIKLLYLRGLALFSYKILYQSEKKNQELKLHTVVISIADSERRDIGCSGFEWDWLTGNVDNHNSSPAWTLDTTLQHG